MIARDAWTVRLFMAAPNVDWTLLRVLAAALDGSTTVEGLLIITEVLADGAAEMRAGGLEPTARELTALADLVGREIAWRSPTLSLPRPA